MTTPQIKGVEAAVAEALRANTPPTKQTIALCMIVRNAEKTVYDAISSVGKHVDEVHVVYAGESTDNTQAEVERAGRDLNWHPEIFTHNFEWIDDFAAARNFSFSFAKSDWLFWIDADDVVLHADQLRPMVARAEQAGYGSIHLPYEYRHDEHGNVTVLHTRERLFRRDLKWQWNGRVHETCDAGVEHLVAQADDVVVKHRGYEVDNPDRNARNLRLLRLMEQDQVTPRVLGTIAEHLAAEGQHEEGIAYYERFFEVAPNIEMRWHAACELARCNLNLKRYDETKRWCMSAILIEPKYALPFILMAHAIWFGEQEAEDALYWLRDSEGRAEAPLNVFRQPLDYTVMRWDVEHRCYAAQGRWLEAMQTIGKKMEVLPLDQDATYFGFYYGEQVHIEASLDALNTLCDHFFRRGDTLRARKLLETCVPLSVRTDPRLQPLYRRVHELTEHVFDDAKYLEFYENYHSSTEEDAMASGLNTAVNATRYEPYRMEPLVARLKARGARKVLDVGCGAGEPAMYLAAQGFDVLGLDINKPAIKEAKRRAKEKKSTARFRQGTLDSLNDEDLGKFDAVVMMEIIEHIQPSRTLFYLGCAEDLLNPGGAIFLTTPGMAIGDIPGLWEDFPRDHVIEYSQKDLEDMILGLPGPRTVMSLHKLFDDTAHAPGFANWLVEYELGNDLDEPVVIYVGPGLEDWTPDYPEKYGLGGSETWAIKVAKEFRKKGHPVIVYGMADGVWDGVVYRPHYRYAPEGPYAGHRAWLTIVSRYAEMLDTRPNAEHVALMMHDVDCGDAFTQLRAVNADRVLVLSDWHKAHVKETYPWLTEGKLRIVANGIEPDYFKAEVEHKPHMRRGDEFGYLPHDAPRPDEEELDSGLWRLQRKSHSFIWSSSPDRGLDRLLEWWPEVRKLWDDATLDIFYGWDNIDRLMPQRPYLALFKEKVTHMARQPGVKWHGRIGQKQLAEEMGKHQFWLYPSVTPDDQVWNETYCITALEAQAGGCIPIVPRAGALPERIYNGTVFDSDRLDLERVIGVLREWDEMGYGSAPEGVFENTWERATGLIVEALAERKALVPA